MSGNNEKWKKFKMYYYVYFILLSTGAAYKQSTQKGNKELEFIPVNLHLQRMTVINEIKDISKFVN